MIKIVRQNHKQNTSSFKKTKEKLEHNLNGNVVIEHIGSTAIPKMSGKNIIDIAIGVKSLPDVEIISKQIDKMNFYRGSNNHCGEYIFFASRIDETRSGDTHLHIVVENSDRYNDFMAIKDYLLSNPTAVKEYTLIKHKLAKQSSLNRNQYKLLKSEYMNKLLLKSRTYVELKKAYKMV